MGTPPTIIKEDIILGKYKIPQYAVVARPRKGDKRIWFMTDYEICHEDIVTHYLYPSRFKKQGIRSANGLFRRIKKLNDENYKRDNLRIIN